MNLYVLGGFLLGLLLGYLVFYYRFADRTIVSELRKTLKETKKNLDHVRDEAEEYREQNIILRSKVQDLLSSNDDFSKVVSDLSRYYYQIKKGAEKAQELSGFLRVPDPEMEDKIKSYVDQKNFSQNHSMHDSSQERQFF